MPINPNALGASEPETGPGISAPTPQEAREDAAQAAEQGKRKRRTKAELIADAVVPGNQDQVDLKDGDSGAKIQRPWLVAVEMIRDGKAEFADKSMKYAMLKYDEQKAAAEREAKSPDATGDTDQGRSESPADEVTAGAAEPVKSAHIPDDAQPGDEVKVGEDTFRVGHGGVLTTSPVQTFDTGDATPATVPVSNGNGGSEITVESKTQPVDVQKVGQIEWKIGTGILRKIGLPDYSSLQVGPISASRLVLDDGRRSKVVINGREAIIPTAVIEGFREVSDTVEFVANYQQGELVSFLEATGVLTQPASYS
jgi:hypothetical protein